MKRFWTAYAVILCAIAGLTGCSEGNTSIQSATGATITSLSPSGILLGGPDFTLTVTAFPSNGFSNVNTVVEWNGQKLVSTVVDGTTITATVPAALIAKPGTAFVNTFFPQSGSGQNGLSNSLSFLVFGAPNPVPTLTSVTPNSVPVCTSKCSNLAITLAGTDFLPSSTNGSSTATFTGLATSGIETAINITSISATQIIASVPASYLTSADTARINVINPPSGVCVVNCPGLGGGNTGRINGNGTEQTLTIGNPAPTSATAVAEETPAISQDGRYVAFSGIQNGASQIMLRDTCLGADKECAPSTKTISVTVDGTVANAESHTPVISSDGRFIAFSSAATNLVDDVPKGKQIYLRDTCVGATAECKPSLALISTDPEGALTGTDAILPSISSSGRFVAFVAVTPDKTANAAVAKSAASSSANSGLRQVFLRDTCFGAANCTPKTTRISLQPGDAPANSAKPAGPALSGLAKQIALAEGKTATSFTHTVPVDDSVFLAIPAEPK
jgi:hypothetical protein